MLVYELKFSFVLATEIRSEKLLKSVKQQAYQKVLTKLCLSMLEIERGYSF
jgi:hypothetical protein